MTLRPIIAVAALGISAVVTAYLVYDENVNDRIAPSEVDIKHKLVQQDPLMDMQFLKSQREANFKSFGLEGEMLQAALKTTQVIEDQQGPRITRLIQEAGQPVELADALCGRASSRRQRYDALQFLVEEKRGERLPIDLARTSQLERQEWALTSTTEVVYTRLELAQERQGNATLMGIAAILSRNEKAAIEGLAPWGSGLAPGTWSWDRVKKENPGIEERSMRYFAMMHLFVEVAHSEEASVCES